MKNRKISITLLSLIVLIAGVGVAGAQVDPVWKFYGESPAQRAAFFLPDGAGEELRPAVVILHGGGWAGGTALWAFSSAQRFVDMGMVAVAVDYHLSDHVRFTPVDALDDTKLLIRWLREHAAEYGVDVNRIAAYGWSAGGHLAASAAIFGGMGAKPDLLILKSPALDVVHDSWFVRLIGDSLNAADYSPVEHVKPGLPPTLILQGSTDSVTPLSGVETFHRLMLDAGNQSQLKVYEGYGHLFTPASERDDGNPNPDPEVVEDSWRVMSEFLKSMGYVD